QVVPVSKTTYVVEGTSGPVRSTTTIYALIPGRARRIGRARRSPDRTPHHSDLRGAPGADALSVPSDGLRIGEREVVELSRVASEIEQVRPSRADLLDVLQPAVAQPEQAERVVGEKQREARMGIERRRAVVL